MPDPQAHQVPSPHRERLYPPGLPQRSPGGIVSLSSLPPSCRQCAELQLHRAYVGARHSFATMTLTAGGDIYTTSKMLEHTNIHTTEIYAEVVMEKKVDAINLTNGLFD